MAHRTVYNTRFPTGNSHGIIVTQLNRALHLWLYPLLFCIIAVYACTACPGVRLWVVHRICLWVANGCCDTTTTTTTTNTLLPYIHDVPLPFFRGWWSWRFFSITPPALLHVILSRESNSNQRYRRDALYLGRQVSLDLTTLTILHCIYIWSSSRLDFTRTIATSGHNKATLSIFGSSVFWKLPCLFVETRLIRLLCSTLVKWNHFYKILCIQHYFFGRSMCMILQNIN